MALWLKIVFGDVDVGYFCTWHCFRVQQKQVTFPSINKTNYTESNFHVNCSLSARVSGVRIFSSHGRNSFEPCVELNISDCKLRSATRDRQINVICWSALLLLSILAPMLCVTLDLGDSSTSKDALIQKDGNQQAVSWVGVHNNILSRVSCVCVLWYARKDAVYLYSAMSQLNSWSELMNSYSELIKKILLKRQTKHWTQNISMPRVYLRLSCAGELGVAYSSSFYVYSVKKCLCILYVLRVCFIFSHFRRMNAKGILSK